MSAILIISVLLVFAASFAIIRRKRSRSNAEADALPPFDGARGLFTDAGAAPRLSAGVDEEDAPLNLERKRRGDELRERASRGDFEALAGARAVGDAALYGAVLGALLDNCAGDSARLRALGEFVARAGDLRSSPALASALLEEWGRGPSRSLAATLLRVAALSDDASVFERAADALVRARLEGRAEAPSSAELRALIDAEYWLLPSEARRSGAGFRLKQKLAQARRALSDGARRGHLPSNAAPRPAGDAAQRETQ